MVERDLYVTNPALPLTGTEAEPEGDVARYRVSQIGLARVTSRAR